MTARPASNAMIKILSTGPQATVRDLGRPGYAAWGIARGGAADRANLQLANRLVGNPENNAAVEVLLGGLAAKFHSGALIAVTGAPTPLWLNDTQAGRIDGPQWVPPDTVIRLGAPIEQLYTYLAVRGGLRTEVVLGSRSVDESSGIGRPLRVGDTIAVGSWTAGPPLVDQAPRTAWPTCPLTLHGTVGPRDDWFTTGSLARLVTHPYTVEPATNRIGVRLSGPPLGRHIEGELLSEPTLRGAVEIPGDGLPIIFGADHPTTCGYPVIAVLDPSSADRLSQCRPGQPVTFRLRRPEIRLVDTAHSGEQKP